MHKSEENDLISIPVKKIINILKVAILPILIAFFLILIVHDNESVKRDLEKTTEDGWKYIRLYDNDEKCEFIAITGYEGKAYKEDLEIPGRIEELPVKVLKGHLFEYGYKINTLTIPREVEQIMDKCFDVVYINEIVFEEDSNLREINGRNTFGAYGYTKIHLSDGVETLGAGTFEYAFQLEEIYIGPNVREIGDGSFYSTKLEKIEVDPENEWFEVRDGFLIEKSSGRLLSYDHKKYEEEVTIPEYIKEIDEETLDGFSLRKINVAEENEYYKSINGCLYTKDGKILCRVPEGMQSEDFELADGIETIGSFACRSCVYLDKISIPASVKRIDFWSFDDQELYIPKNSSLEIADFQTYTGTIHFADTEEEWKKIHVTNAAYSEDNPDYNVIFEED